MGKTVRYPRAHAHAQALEYFVGVVVVPLREELWVQKED